MMEPGLRACIAFVAGRIIRQEEANVVFDHTRSLAVQFHAEFEESNVFLYDYVRRCHVTVSGDGHTFALHDYGSQGRVALMIEGEQFNGFDHVSQQQFHGSVIGDEVTLSLPGAWPDDRFELRLVEP